MGRLARLAAARVRPDAAAAGAVIAAGHDLLRDEGRPYADAMSAAGNRVQYLYFERQIHSFFALGRVIDEACSAIALGAAVICKALGA